MVRTERTVTKRQGTARDAAVEGLLAGVAAGIAMATALVIAGLLAGEGPARILARFDPATVASPATGALIHLAVSAVYGSVFGVIYWLVGRGRLERRSSIPPRATEVAAIVAAVSNRPTWSPGIT